MGNVPLMPKRYVLEPGLSVGTNHPRQPADLLEGYRVALVWHGRGTLLLLAEEFLRLAYFGALQVPDLSGHHVQSGRDDRQGRQIVRVTIPLDHLRGNLRCFQSQTGTDLFFELR